MAKKDDKLERIKCARNLKCALTQEEISDASEKMARRIADKDGLENEFDSVKQQFKDRIGAAELDVSNCARLVREKAEFRFVDCEEVKDFDAGRFSVIRLDTEEVIASRKLRMDERQGRLPLEEKAEA